MIVEQIMKKKVISLTEDASIEIALKLMNEHHIRHIPIVNHENRVVGIVSDRDIRDACPSIFQKSLDNCELGNPISRIMKRDVITGHPLDFVEEVSAIFYENEIGCLPITRSGKLVGILTETDVLHTFVQLTGAHQPGSQLEVKVPNKAGALAEITALISQHKVNVLSVLIYPSTMDDQVILVFRIQTINPTKIISEIQEKGYEVLWPNLPGMSEQ